MSHVLERPELLEKIQRFAVWFLCRGSALVTMCVQ